MTQTKYRRLLEALRYEAYWRSFSGYVHGGLREIVAAARATEDADRICSQFTKRTKKRSKKK